MSKESALAVAMPQTVPVNPPPGGEAQTTAPSKPSSNDAPPELSNVTPPSEVQSKTFSILAKKEAEILRQRQELKSAQEQVTPILKRAREFEDLRKKDPVAALKMLGFSETEIFNYMAQQAPQELTPEQKAIQAAEAAADAKIKVFEESQAKKEAEIQKKADESVIQSYRSSVSQVIQANPEKFEYCNHYGPAAEDLIFETVKAVVQKSQGKDVPTAEEAAQLVEEFYEEQDQAMNQLKKRQPVAAVTPPPLEEPKIEPPSKPSRTLNHGTTVTAASVRPHLHESFAQKRERLIEKLKNGG